MAVWKLLVLQRCIRQLRVHPTVWQRGIKRLERSIWSLGKANQEAAARGRELESTRLQRRKVDEDFREKHSVLLLYQTVRAASALEQIPGSVL